MSEAPKLPVILCWHMHQPEYRNLATGEYQLPWTYLHAIKDYVDMAAHLEAEPAAHAVVNFAPVLLDQIADYVAQLDAHLARDTAITDPLLAALAAPVLPRDPAQRLQLLKSCLRSNVNRVIQRFPPYQRLVATAETYLKAPDTLIYVADQFLADLLVWYHLAWIAETVRRTESRVRQLQDQMQAYTLADRRQLLSLLLELLRSIVPRYRTLAESGQVELAMSPYAHPIVPILLDPRVAKETLPDAPMPGIDGYPGGEDRAIWHLRYGRAVFQRHFGREPAGCWPSEGAISNATLRLLAAEGFRWIASGESVLRNSLEPALPECRHRVYRLDGVELDCFFRDDGLSDLIGFRYADWRAEDAVGNLLHHLEQIAQQCPDCSNCAVAIVLDGENAWEYYPENAAYFLATLYQRIGDHPQLRSTTFEAFQRDNRPVPLPLARVRAGSWVYGTLSTWIGSPDKNRGWEILADAKRCYDRVIASGRLSDTQRERAELQLAACEGSDWFWWFGDYNPAAAVGEFERLFRMHLGNLYRLLDEPAPAYLADTFSHGGGEQVMGGVMRTSTDHGAPHG